VQIGARYAERVVQEIDYHPAGGIRDAVKLDVQGFADDAAAAVAANQPLCTKGALTGFGFDLQGDMIPFVRERHDLAAEDGLDIVEPRQALVQNLVDHGLDEGVPAGPAELSRLGIDERECLARHGQEAHFLCGRGMARDHVCQTDRLKAAQALVVHSDAARIVDQFVPLLDDKRVDAHAAQIVRDGQSNRACADNHDIGRFGKG
jgi:hypothetical protein